MVLPYAVVRFEKEDTYLEIPSLWLLEDKTKCRWPRSKNVTFFIKRSQAPDNDWPIFDVQVECYCGKNCIY